MECRSEGCLGSDGGWTEHLHHLIYDPLSARGARAAKGIGIDIFIPPLLRFLPSTYIVVSYVATTTHTDVARINLHMHVAECGCAAKRENGNVDLPTFPIYYLLLARAIV